MSLKIDLSKHPTLVVLAFIALIWVITTTIEFLEYRFRENAVEVTAIFLEDEYGHDSVKQREAMGARPDSYIVSYSFEGKNYEKTLQGVNENDEFSTSAGSKPVPGATVEALLDPENPSQIFIKEPQHRWFGTTIISLILFGMIGLIRLLKD